MFKNKWVLYLGFFGLLVLGFWLFVFKGTDKWKKKSPILTYVQPFAFKNQDGIRFTNQDMLGKVNVVEFFFTTCKGICPNMNSNMLKVYNRFKSYPDFQIVAHTCDPDRDSVPVLKKYADSLGIDTHKWVFLTGRKDSLYKQARVSYLLDDPKNELKDVASDFIHTQFFAVVDKNGRVRGQIFDGLKTADLQKLENLVQRLLDEPAEQTNFVNGIFNNNPQ
ncbi:MAG: SCO family protein [Chitinophagaceae bacterium]|jgi:protein SCO1/2